MKNEEIKTQNVNFQSKQLTKELRQDPNACSECICHQSANSSILTSPIFSDVISSSKGTLERIPRHQMALTNHCSGVLTVNKPETCEFKFPFKNINIKPVREKKNP